MNLEKIDIGCGFNPEEVTLEEKSEPKGHTSTSKANKIKKASKTKIWLDSFYKSIENENAVDLSSLLSSIPKNIKINQDHFSNLISKSFNAEILDLLNTKDFIQSSNIDFQNQLFINKSISDDNDKLFDYFINLYKNNAELICLNINSVSRIKDYFGIDLPLNPSSLPIQEVNIPEIMLIIYENLCLNNNIKYRKKLEKLIPEIKALFLHDTRTIGELIENGIEKNHDLLEYIPIKLWQDFFSSLINGYYWIDISSKESIPKLNNLPKKFPNSIEGLKLANQESLIKYKKCIIEMESHYPYKGNILEDPVFLKLKLTHLGLGSCENYMDFILSKNNQATSFLGLPVNTKLRNLFREFVLPNIPESVGILNPDITSASLRHERPSLFDRIVSIGGENLTDIIKTKSGLNAIMKSLENKWIKFEFCERANIDTICLLLKLNPKLVKEKDEFGNSLIHYSLAFSGAKTKSTALKLLKADKEILYLENNSGYNCLDIMEANGLGKNYRAKICNSMIKKSLNSKKSKRPKSKI